MPPKKAATSSMVGEYDIELMTEEELRMYIEALTLEHKRMREFRNLYHKDKNELLGFLKSVQENIIDRKGEEIQKRSKIQQHMLHSEKKSNYVDLLNRITELENNCKDKNSWIDSFINIKTTQIGNKDDERALLSDISERDRQIQHLEYVHSLMLIQLKENEFIKKCSLSKICESNFERFAKEYDENILEVLEGFSRNKIEDLQTIWGDTSETENNPFANTVEKMTSYFKDIHWKNIKTVEILFSILVNLKKDLNTITLNLHDVTKKNEQFRMVPIYSASPRNSILKSLSFSVAKTKALENLLYENYLLTIKLEMLNKEYSDLKAKFVSAMRKIYQKAGFKTLLLERKLLCLQHSQGNI